MHNDEHENGSPVNQERKNNRGQAQKNLILAKNMVREKQSFKVHDNFSKLPQKSRSNLAGIYGMIRQKVQDEG